MRLFKPTPGVATQNQGMFTKGRDDKDLCRYLTAYEIKLELVEVSSITNLELVSGTISKV